MTPEYRITFARSARKEVQALSPTIAGRILAKVELLSREPRPTGCQKLHGSANLWRIRIGEYRVVYEIDEKNRVIDIVIVRHRSEAYR